MQKFVSRSSVIDVRTQTDWSLISYILSVCTVMAYAQCNALFLY